MSFIDMPTSSDVVEPSQSIMEIQSMSLSDTSEEASREIDGIVEYVTEQFSKAEDRRRVDEDRWLECFRNFRGVYGNTTQFTDSEKSRAFVKITKTKVLAGYAQVVDVLFAGNKFPIGIDPPNIAVGVEGTVHFDPKEAPGGAGGGGESLRSNPTMTPQIAKVFGPMKTQLMKVADKLKAGVGLSPTAVTFDPAKDAAKKMEKKIHDQLNEAQASKSLRSFAFELCLLGTGVYKGPFLTSKEYPKWSEDGTYEPVEKVIPDMDFVSVWDFYPDADAKNMSEAEYVIQRHKMSKTQLRGLKRRPGFRTKELESLISDGPNYTAKDWETYLTDDENVQMHERWEVLEYWGMIDKDLAKKSGIKVPKEYKDFEEYQINVWTSGGRILRLVINPFKPSRIPYHAVPYEANPYSFFGVGIAENMLDSQLLMNGFMRLAVDNAALSSNIIFEVNEDMLVPGQSMEIYPGKVFRRQGGAPGQAFFSSKIENVTNECIMLFDKARQLSDEATGMPSYAHGMTGVMSTGKTAAGMSMLMGAAAQNIKAVVRNIDDYLLSPLGKDLYAFNMQFDFNKDFAGDCVVVAKGTESLMRNEVRSQKLMQLAQFAAGNQAMMPYIKWDYILREYASSLDLEEDKVINDPRNAAIQAAEMAKVQGIMAPQGDPQAQQQAQAQANGQVPGGSIPSPDDPTGNGNGNIGPGMAPEPGAEGFSGQQQGAPQ